MDGTFSVALFTFLGVVVTTIGVIVVALINRKTETTNAGEAGVEAGLDESNVLQIVLTLSTDNARKEQVIQELKAQLATLEGGGKHGRSNSPRHGARADQEG